MMNVYNERYYKVFSTLNYIIIEIHFRFVFNIIDNTKCNKEIEKNAYKKLIKNDMCV